MSLRAERAICAAILVLAWAFFFVQAIHTPTLLDDWYQLSWHRNHPFNVASFWEYAHYNYFNFNPRIGDILLLFVNGPRWIHLLFTPLVQLAIVPLAFALALGRWPRFVLKDFALLFVLQVLIFLIVPIPGVVYFYRPFTTNYVWAFLVMLAFFVPYRLELARPVEETKPRHWMIPLMLVLGWLAGMSNEHTGPTALVAMACLLCFAWRKKRLKPWMIAGAVGLFIGYPMLFFAPGQKLRYAGIAARQTPVMLLQERGISGSFEILVDFVTESQIALTLMAIALLVAVRGVTGKFSRARMVAMLALILIVGLMVATQFASPTIGERLFFAPGVLFAGALLLVVDWMWESRGARRFVVGAAIVVGTYDMTRMATVLADGYQENQVRLITLRAAPIDTVPSVLPYKLWKRSRYWWGDDFAYASLREYVANEVYDLKNIVYDRPLHWAEPPPPDHFVIARRTFEPPLSREEDAKLEPRYVPTYWEWALTQLRRSIKLGPIKFVEGHKLTQYDVDLADSPFADPKHRPIHVFQWSAGKLTYVDGRPYDDPNGQSYVRVWDKTMPTNVVDAYVEGCGQTNRVELVDDRWEHVGPMFPIKLTCRGTYTTFLCEPDVCWFSGRYWR